MKRYIKSYTEPSSYEYGKFMQDRHEKMQERYYPFKVTDTYMTRGSANSDGYRITLLSDDDLVEDKEWIVYKDGGTWDRKLELYGPFDPEEIRQLSVLFRNPVIKVFKDGTLDSVMNYLFERELPDDYD